MLKCLPDKMQLFKDVDEYLLKIMALYEQQPHGPDIISPPLPKASKYNSKSRQIFTPTSNCMGSFTAIS